MTPYFAKAVEEDLANATPVYPCEDCPVVRGEFCWTCQLPFGHLQIKPTCEFCGRPAVTGIIVPYTTKGDYGITYTGFDTIPICASMECLEEAVYVRRMTQ